MPPTQQEDPNWDPEDARLFRDSLGGGPGGRTRWDRTLATPGAVEILSAHVIIWHNVLKLAEQWYWVQVRRGMDKRAETLPLPEPLIGELVRFMVMPRSRTHSWAAAQPQGQLVV